MSLHWALQCHCIFNKPSPRIWDQMGAGGLSSYFQQALRRCGLLILILEAYLNHRLHTRVRNILPSFAWLHYSILCQVPSIHYCSLSLYLSFWLYLSFSFLTLADTDIVCSFHHSQTHQLCSFTAFQLVLDYVNTCTDDDVFSFLYVCSCVGLCAHRSER